MTYEEWVAREDRGTFEDNKYIPGRYTSRHLDRCEDDYLYECNLCFSLIDDDRREAHKGWHDSLQGVRG